MGSWDQWGGDPKSAVLEALVLISLHRKKYLDLYALRGRTHKADCLCQKRPRVSSSQKTVLAANLLGVFQFTALLPKWENKSSRNGSTLWDMVQTVWNIPCVDTPPPKPTTAVALWPGYWIKTLITKAPTGSYGRTDFWKRENKYCKYKW